MRPVWTPQDTREPHPWRQTWALVALAAWIILGMFWAIPHLAELVGGPTGWSWTGLPA